MNTRMLFCLLVLSMTCLMANAQCISACSSASHASDPTGRTFLFVRPLFQSNMPEMVTGFRDKLFHEKMGGWGAFQGVLFGSESYNTAQLQRYFTPFNKTVLEVSELEPASQATAEQGGPYVPTRDLFTQHFNVFTANGTFNSKIQFKPHQSMVGFGMHYRKDFWRKTSENRACYFSISSPLTSVRNTVKLQEEIINDGGGVDLTKSPNAVATMTEAFRQASWEYGRIGSTGAGSKCQFQQMRETKLADMEVKVGIEWIERHPCHFESYVGVLIPTGNKPRGRYIFEPIVGWGGSLGLLFGSHAGATIWHKESSGNSLRLEYSLHSQYLFSNTQTRSFDLKNKPFSRYAQVYTSYQEAYADSVLSSNDYKQNVATPGINVFTRRVHVTPGYMYNVNSALVFEKECGWQVEAGYNLFFRHEDEVRLACEFPKTIALKHYKGAGKTYPVRTISGFYLLEDPAQKLSAQESIENYQYNVITEDDLDMESAAQPGIMTHTLYGYLGYTFDECQHPLSLGAGGSCEFSRATSAALERWVLWFKAGVAF